MRWLCASLLLLSACGGSVDPILDAGTCAPESCTEPDTVCVMGVSGPECQCREGTLRDESGRCAVPTRCAADTCHGRGECTEEGGVHCTCEATFGGPLCERCADGMHDDGAGGCTADACIPNPCTGERRCVLVGGAASCECPAGMHDEGGACVPDQTCMPTTCNGRGECVDDEAGPRCVCSAGWTDAFCDRCDAAAGYHDDGAGGCTMDRCLPNPCTDANRGVCSVVDDVVSCACNAGYHLEGALCVIDETCQTDTCRGHGSCAVVGGVALCTCNPEWGGDSCDACAAGYHTDGAGGCTNDPCLPNPCTVIANRAVCSVDVGGLAVCGCNAGYHDDGVGGCTMDPCMPNPCTALGQACRVNGTSAECYTPDCNDGNPCTEDVLQAGSCVYRPLDNGTACSTTLCLRGQTCTASVCGGGTAVSCDDARPCTVDSCDAARGCLHATDDSIVPSDNVPCTVDSCSAGVESHLASDAFCGDGRWCTGVERCTPGAGADPRGCIATGVPVAPGPTTTCGAYTCNDAAMRFDFTASSAGTPCNDAIACTSGDACDGTGACRGTATSCGSATECSSTVPWSGVIDVAPARITGAVRYGGTTTLPDSAHWTDIDLFLQARDTGMLHFVERVDFSGVSSGGFYPVASFGVSSDRTIDLPMLPGVYDVVYIRGSGVEDPWTFDHYPTDRYAWGRRILRENVVIGPGRNVLDIDIAPARVTGNVRFNGSTDFPGSAHWTDIDLFLRARDTGMLHFVERVDFSGVSSGGFYPVATFGVSSDRSIDLPVLPGAYDVVYIRGTGVDDPWTFDHYPTDRYAWGRRILRENVVIGPGTTTLDIEIAPARVMGNVRYNGADTFPGSAHWTDIDLFLRARDTGMLHFIERVDFSGTSSGGFYPVATFGVSSDRTIDLPLSPGAYDIVYIRGAGVDDTWTYDHYPTDSYAWGRRILRENVVIGPGTTTLDIDIAPARVMGNVRYGGSMDDFPGSAHWTDIDLFLRARDTGMLHFLERVDYSGVSSGGTYPVATFGVSSDRTIDLPMLPGVYDVVYIRGSGVDDPWTFDHYPTDSYAWGRRILRENVVVGPGTTMLDIDIAPARVMGNVRYDGSTSLPASAHWTDIDLFLRARDTGMLHFVERIDYSGVSSGGTYPVATFGVSSDRTIDLPMLPGIYDIVYIRGSGVDDPWTFDHYPTDNYAWGHRILRENVVIGPGTTTLDIDVAPARIAGTLRYDGSTAFPGSAHWTDIDLFLRARDTGMLHFVERIDYSGVSSGGTYPVATFGVSSDRTIELPMLPGIYDVVYIRGSGVDDPWTFDHYPTDNYAWGRRYLAGCIEIAR